MKISALALFLASFVFTGCAKQPAVGAAQDSHGCKSSAGYSWCAASKRCERPWELAKKQNFDNSEADFAAFCHPKNENL